MTAEPRPVLMKHAQVLLGQLAKRPERHIVGPGGVPFRKDKLIRWEKNAVVQDQQEVKAREIASDMPNSTLIMHSEKSKLGANVQIVPASGRTLHGQ